MSATIGVIAQWLRETKIYTIPFHPHQTKVELYELLNTAMVYQTDVMAGEIVHVTLKPLHISVS